MDQLTLIILYTFCAGLCIPIGGAIANVERIRPSWLENELRHSIIAFGGGILLAAVALVLVPEGREYIQQPVLGMLILLLGGVFFFLFELYLGYRKSEKPQLSAMLLDYIPESIALGGAFAIGAKSAPLLALIIGLQNLPEAFNAFRELRVEPKDSALKILSFMVGLAFLGPIFGAVGYVFFSQNTVLLGATMLFASGGILYLIFQDIAPQSRMQRHWAPPLGAVIGFSLGMLGHSLVVIS
jgi:ZIP family zinc transporter